MFLRKNDCNSVPKLLMGYTRMAEGEFKTLLSSYIDKFDTNNNVPKEFVKLLKEV